MEMKGKTLCEGKGRDFIYKPKNVQHCQRHQKQTETMEDILP